MRFLQQSAAPRRAGIVLIILFCVPFLLAAQDEEPSDEIDWGDYKYELYARGDRTLLISVGLVFPTVSSGKNEFSNKINPPLGGTGSFAFNYFLNSKLTVGGELGGMFLPTEAKNTLFMIYLGGRVGTQFIAGRFEFPIHFSMGMSWQTYLNLGHYSLYLRAGGSVFFRATSTWAFGLSTSWFFVPQWTYDSESNKRTREKDVFANFLDLTLSARYQF